LNKKNFNILVVIANFGNSQLKYLEQIIKEYNLMTYNVKIIIHSNIPLPYEDIEVKIFKLKNTRELPLTTRQTIYENKENYDLFIFTENDILITEKNIDAYLKATKILPENYIAGFFRYEKGKKGLSYPDDHNPHKWDIKSVFKIGDYVFAHFRNVHQACYVLTKEQLNQVIKNFDFVKKNRLVSEFLKGEDIESNQNIEVKQTIKNKFLKSVAIAIIHILSKKFLDRLKKQYTIKKLKLLEEYIVKDNIHKYRLCAFAGAEIYFNGGFKKVIPISHFDDFLIYHLSNKYIGKYGKSDNIMRNDIKRLIKKVKKIKIIFDFIDTIEFISILFGFLIIIIIIMVQINMLKRSAFKSFLDHLFFLEW